MDGHARASGWPSRCYTDQIVIRGFFGTLLVAMGMWGSFHILLLVKGTAAPCQSACASHCCMHGGVCSMMKHGVPMRMEPEPNSASDASPARPFVACSCSLSQPATTLMAASHADLLFDLPQSKLDFVLPSSFNSGASQAVFWPAADNQVPDPPPKAFPS